MEENAKVVRKLAEGTFERGHTVTLKALEGGKTKITIEYVDGGEQDFIPVPFAQERLEDAMRKLHVFAMNHPHDFIERTWKDDPRMEEHFLQKYHGFRMQLGGDPNPTHLFFEWLKELDAANRSKLFDFILKWDERHTL